MLDVTAHHPTTTE